MMRVESILGAAAASRAAWKTSAGGALRAPSRPTTAGKARWYFVASIAFAALAMGAVPAWWAHRSGDAASQAALIARLAVFFLNMAALAATMAAVGVAVTGQRMGVLWSARNVYSLSRLQVALWTLLVLAALASVVACRAHGLFMPADANGLVGALNIEIPGTLLAVMGISIASGAVAPAIVAVRANAAQAPAASVDAASARVGGEVQALGKVLVRPADCPPMVKDLFQGDDVAKAGTVDIGKLQQAVVTAVIWCAYLAMMTELFLLGESRGKDGATALPAMSDTFVYLLGISHAGYLAYKAAPSPAPGNNASSAGAPSLLPSQVLPRPLPPTIQ